MPKVNYGFCKNSKRVSGLRRSNGKLGVKMNWGASSPKAKLHLGPAHKLRPRLSRAGTPPTSPAPPRSSPQVPVKPCGPASLRYFAGCPPSLDLFGEIACECVTFPSSGAVWPSPSLQPPGKRAGPGRKDLGPSGFARLGPPGPRRWKCSVGFRCPPWGLPSVACWVRGRLRPGVGGQPGVASASWACSSRTWTTLPGIGGPRVEGRVGRRVTAPKSRSRSAGKEW